MVFQVMPLTEQEIEANFRDYDTINSALTCKIKQDLKILELKLYTYITLHN